MKTPMVSSATSFQRLQTSLQSPMPRLPRSNVYSTQDPANPSASVHRKRFFTPSLTLKFLCAGYLNRGKAIRPYRRIYDIGRNSGEETVLKKAVSAKGFRKKTGDLGSGEDGISLFWGHAATFRSSPTVFAETSMPDPPRPAPDLAGHQEQCGGRQCFSVYIAEGF